MESKISALIVDDEPNGRNALTSLLERFCPEVEVLGSANDVESGLQLLTELQPDLVFLDVEMPPHSGFDLLRQAGHISFEVIFTTAYDQYALQAIKASALDYLMKPIDHRDLKAAVSKAAVTILARKKQNIPLTKLAFPTQESIIFIDPENIIRIEASPGHKCCIVLTGGKELVINKEMTSLESQLEGLGFLRTHRSHIINTRYMVEYVNDKSGGCIVMEDNKLVPVSAQNRKKLLALYIQ